MALPRLYQDLAVKVKELLERNREWAAKQIQADPEFFTRLEHQQKPKFLWIGCSDSRVPANQITGLPPGQVFVHRNIANLVLHTDFNCLSVIQYAVEVLEIEHIIVCGHYGCSGIQAALSQEPRGFVDNWLRHVKDVHTLHRHELDLLEPLQKEHRLEELNVMHQVLNVGESSFVEKAWTEGRKLSVHGWIYALADGILNDLGVTLRDSEATATLRQKILSLS